MQAKTKTVPYEFFDPVYSGSCETPIDTEFNLPDYCPDIQKLLKCRAVPEVSSYMISGDTLTVDGVMDVRVLYLDGKGDCVRCAEFTKEFTQSVKLKSAEEKAVACVQATPLFVERLYVGHCRCGDDIIAFHIAKLQTNQLQAKDYSLNSRATTST